METFNPEKMSIAPETAEQKLSRIQKLIEINEELKKKENVTVSESSDNELKEMLRKAEEEVEQEKLTKEK